MVGILRVKPAVRAQQEENDNIYLYTYYNMLYWDLYYYYYNLEC